MGLWEVKSLAEGRTAEIIIITVVTILGITVCELLCATRCTHGLSYGTGNERSAGATMKTPPSPKSRPKTQARLLSLRAVHFFLSSPYKATHFSSLDKSNSEPVDSTIQVLRVTLLLFYHKLSTRLHFHCDFPK